MSKQMVIGLVVAAIVAALIVFGVVTYAEHVRQDADTKAKIAIEQGKVEAAEQRIQQISKDVADKNSELEKLKGAKPPQQTERIIHDYLPLPTAEVLPDTPSASGEPQHSKLTLEDANHLKDFGLSCRQCENERDGATQKLAEKDTELTAVKKQRDDAIAGAKGGTFFKRLKNNTKWLVIGIGVGAAAGAVAHH